jgi:hypothetical protein
VFIAAIADAKSPDEAAVALGLPEGWKFEQSTTPGGQSVRRIINTDGITFRSFAAVRRCHGDEIFSKDSAAWQIVDADDEADQDPPACGGGDEDIAREALGPTDGKTNKGNRRARALALGNGDAYVALQKASVLLSDAEATIGELKSRLVDIARHAEQEKQAFEATSADVREAQRIEAEAVMRLKAVEQRRREAKEDTVAKKRRLDEVNATLIMLDLEASRVAAAATSQTTVLQEIAELERVAAEAQRVVEENQQREREARDKMKKLVKEQTKLSRFGPFGRRMRSATQAKAIKDAFAEASSVTDKVTIKREVLEAFGSHRSRAPIELAMITIDDD